LTFTVGHNLASAGAISLPISFARASSQPFRSYAHGALHQTTNNSFPEPRSRRVYRGSRLIPLRSKHRRKWTYKLMPQFRWRRKNGARSGYFVCSARSPYAHTEVQLSRTVMAFTVASQPRP
jgi:hypothetical protein